jgi:Protein of unknown function (DUF3040)
MLSEAEQRRLTEIESQLQADDPAFVRWFGDQGQQRLPPSWYGVAALAATMVAVVAAGIGLAVDSVGLVVIALIVIGASAGMWITNRRP